MKNQKLLLTTGLVLFTVSVTWAQQPVPPAEKPGIAALPPPPAPGGPGKEAGPALREITTYKGTVMAYAANDHFEYDSFTFKTFSKTYSVKFPAHMAEKLMKLAGKGKTVTVNGVAETDPQGVQAIRMATIETGGTVLSDTPPAIPANETQPEDKMYSGKITELLRNREGRINALIVNNTLLLSFPPHIMEQLGSVVKSGESVDVFGFARPARSGVVSTRKLSRIEAKTLKIAGKTYLVR